MAAGEDLSPYRGDVVALSICGLPVRAIVANADAPIAAEGFDVAFIVCGSPCAKVIQMGAAFDAMTRGCAEPVLTPGAAYDLRVHSVDWAMKKESVEAFGLLAEAIKLAFPTLARRLGVDWAVSDSGDGRDATVELAYRCAWCLKPLAGRDVVHSLMARVRSPKRALQPGFMAFDVGDRLVPCWVPTPDSPAAADGDIGFTICSKACNAALAAALQEHARLSVVH
jgi:hypothetical protein